MELEPSSGTPIPAIDLRPLIPPPLPVRVVAVEDVKLPAPAGAERKLEQFYAGLLGFERDPREPNELIFRAENVRLRFEILEPPITRDSMRMLGLEVPALSALEPKLLDLQLEYVRQRGLLPGQDAIVFQDPAGNWLSVSEIQLLL
jgi:hypothetical protein